MPFSESKFQVIMSSLRSDEQKTNEKRRSPRVGVGVRGIILLHRSRRVVNVFVRDLSLGGIGITCDQAIESGDHFSLLLTKPDGKATHVLYEVRHCRMAINGIYDVGAQKVSSQSVAPSEMLTKSQGTRAGADSAKSSAAAAHV